MKIYMGNSYFANHPGYNKLMDNKIEFSKHYVKKTELEIGSFFLNKQINVLEIGFGSGNFVNYCNSKGIKKYTGIDIDDTFSPSLKKLFPEYEFHKIHFSDFLKDKENTYDIIFCSHVVEHLEQDEATDLIQLIYKSLKKGGVWINYMPNANAVLQSNFGRYIDLTHKTIYTPSSFEQLINYANVNFSNIDFLNSKIATNFIKSIIHGFFLTLTKIYYIGMGGMRVHIYTFEFITIIKK